MELEKVGAENQCKQYRYFAVKEEQEGRTYTQSGMTNYPGYPTPDMNLGTIPTEVCSKAKNHCLAMIWIKEVETAKSIDDLTTTRSIVGRTDFPDYDELGAMMASALRKLYDRHTHFR